MIRYIALSILLILSLDLQSQVVNPKIWYLGYQDPQIDTNSLDTGILKGWGSTILDFRLNPFSIFRKTKTLSIGNCNSFIFNSNDSLVLYTNGSKVFNNRHRLIEGADSLCYGKDWKTSPYAGNYFGQYYIASYPQPILCLQSVENKNQYFLISIFIRPDTSSFYKIVYSVIDMSLNNGLGKLIKKETVLKTGDFTESISACKHANGRDWWILTREYKGTCYSIFLFDSSGINLISDNQCMGFDLSDRNLYKRNAINKFSWDGKLFASFSHNGIELYDFDRCKGLLSNRRVVTIPYNDSFPFGGGCFSPNSKLLYANNAGVLYQLEISNLKLREISRWDYSEDTIEGGNASFYTNFGNSQLSFDGKIYFETAEPSHYLHSIENPNQIGVLCNFIQRSVKLLTWNAGIPNYPNYELGADTSCHGSSIDEPERYKIDIYPNPASSYIDIEGGVSKSEIYNVLGQTVLMTTTKRINVSWLEEGIYFIYLRDRKGELVRKERIVIQR